MMKKTRVIAAVFGLCVCLAMAGQPVAADWSWGNGEELVTSQVMRGYNDPHQVCAGTPEMMTVSGVSDLLPLCVMQKSPGVEVATYADNHGTVLRFGQDTVAYPLYGCSPSWCLYDPAQDAVITKQNIINSIVTSLVIYKHASQRLQKSSGGYSFDLSQSDYVDWNSDGYALPVGALALSSNGRWLAMEYRGNGFGVMDMSELTMTKVSTMPFYYGVGTDPSIELAVSNDSRQVAITGFNAVDLFIETTPGCGFDPLQASLPNVTTCEIMGFDNDLRGIQNGFQYSARPSFNDDGSQLTVASVYWPSTVRVATLRAVGSRGQTLDFLGLGDSYSSGEGETDDQFYLPHTNDPFEKCHTSARSYPYLVATLQGVADVHNVACSGARMTDIESPLTDYLGQSNRLGAQGLGLGGDQVSAYQQVALANFQPGDVPQAYFVDRYQPRIITVGIGGNDAGFMDKMRACMMPDECEWVSSTGKAQARQEIGALQPKLTSLYQDLHRRSPDSHIYAVGYPQIIKPDGVCDVLTTSMFNDKERLFISESINYIDRVIATAARDAGVDYINIEDAYGDHRACGGSSQLAVNELQFGDDVAPVGVLPDVKLFGDESFHPTPLGHQLVAAVIQQQIATSAPPSGSCVDSTCQTAPAPPADWTDTAPVQTIAAQMSPSSVVSLKTPQLTITLAPNDFQPGSITRIEVHSNPMVLATPVTNNDGSLTQAITLPPDLSPGYHTVHVYGLSYAGQSVDYYQTVLLTTEQPIASTPSVLNGTLLAPLPHINDRSTSPLVLTTASLALPDAIGAVKGVSTSRQPAPSSPALQGRGWWKVAVVVGLVGLLITGMTWLSQPKMSSKSKE